MCVCVCVCVALGIQHAVRRIVIVACEAPEYFSTLSHKWHDCRKNVTEHKTCVSDVFLYILPEIFLIQRRILRDMIKIVNLYFQKVTLILSDFNETWIFLTYFQKILKYQISWQSIWWEPVPCGRKDTTNLIIAFCSFANLPKNPGPTMVHACVYARIRRCAYYVYVKMWVRYSFVVSDCCCSQCH